MAKLAPGDSAPDFELADQHGKMVKLADFKGRKLLLYFYPKADTPGCTRQACSVRDAREELAALGLAWILCGYAEQLEFLATLSDEQFRSPGSKARHLARFLEVARATAGKGLSQIKESVRGLFRSVSIVRKTSHRSLSITAVEQTGKCTHRPNLTEDRISPKMT